MAAMVPSSIISREQIYKIFSLVLISLLWNFHNRCFCHLVTLNRPSFWSVSKLWKSFQIENKQHKTSNCASRVISRKRPIFAKRLFLLFASEKSFKSVHKLKAFCFGQTNASKALIISTTQHNNSNETKQQQQRQQNQNCVPLFWDWSIFKSSKIFTHICCEKLFE